ncbi:MAG: hypothetical protein OEV44_07610 [Spirochaetota bacterium]|nr:hypothetical protein [Spirochaetota bacterium]
MSDTKNYEKHEVLVKFMSPGSRLAGDTYDDKGNKIKSYNEPFTKKEIEELKSKGIEKLYYVKERPKEESKEEKIDISSSEKDIKQDDINKSMFLCDVEKRARLMACNFGTNLYDYFMPRIIANGLAIFKADNQDFAKTIFEKYQISHILLDSDIDPASWMMFVERLKDIRKDFQLLIFQGLSGKESFDNFAKRDLDIRVYDKGMDNKELIKKVIDDINSSDPYFSQRNHLKILLTEEDQIKADIYLSKEQVITGNGYSISPLELTFTLAKLTLEGEMYNFSVGDRLDRISLTILGKIILTQGEITKLERDTRRVTLKFTHRTESLLNGIGKMITDRLKKIHNIY